MEKQPLKGTVQEAAVRTHRPLLRKYIFVLLDYFIKNPENIFLHGETLNVLFQSNPSTKEQNFLSQMLFRYIDEREGELIRPWLRIH